MKGVLSLFDGDCKMSMAVIGYGDNSYSHPPPCAFLLYALQNSGNPSRIRLFKCKGVCTKCVKTGSLVYRLNVKVREYRLYELYKKAILRNEDGLTILIYT